MLTLHLAFTTIPQNTKEMVRWIVCNYCAYMLKLILAYYCFTNISKESLLFLGVEKKQAQLCVVF